MWITVNTRTKYTSGRVNLLQTILLSVLYKKSPKELDLYVINNKITEFLI